MRTDQHDFRVYGLSGEPQRGPWGDPTSIAMTAVRLLTTHKRRLLHNRRCIADPGYMVDGYR